MKYEWTINYLIMLDEDNFQQQYDDWGFKKKIIERKEVDACVDEMLCQLSDDEYYALTREVITKVENDFCEWLRVKKKKIIVEDDE